MIKKIFKRTAKSFEGLPIKSKLLLTYFILIILPLGFFTYLTYKRVSTVVQEQTFASASQVFNESIKILDKELENTNNVINIITHDRFIYEVSSRDPMDYDFSKQLEDSNGITNMFNHLKETTGVHNIRIYLNSDFVFSDENVNMFNLENIKNSRWYNILSSQPNNTLWCPPSYFEDQPVTEQNFFSALRIIYKLDNLGEKLAILRVDTKKEKVSDVINSAVLTKSAHISLISEKDTIISSAVSEETNMQDIEFARLKDLPAGVWNSLEIDKKKVFVNYKKLDLVDWYLVSTIPYKDILSTGTRLKNEMLVSMLVIAAISYLMAYFISKSSVSRLSILTQTMRKVQKGDLKVSFRKVGSDEIGELMTSFNEMVSQISILLEEKYNMGQEIKNSELKALQAQINPHFLYNSLDLINCMAIKQNIPEITSMVNALARFYKLSLSRGRNVIPIKDEISHAQIYMQIQNMRFDNRIKLYIDIAAEVYEYLTLKIILQPIIENSIIHGIFEKESKSGTIRICGRLQGETILFVVEDDGVGMTEEKIKQVFSQEKTVSNKGYGIKNINDRIKLAYGEKYGLHYSSVPGEGTKVEIRIPAIRE